MENQPRIVMLAVGVGQYRSADINDLTLPVSDARAMVREIGVLGNERLEVRLLLDEQATKQAIREGFTWLAENATPDDLAIFYFSGHGARSYVGGSGEEDKYDEFICPVDTGMGGGVETFIRDDEMREWIKDVTARTRQFAVLLDSCHSGDAVRRGAATPKELNPAVVRKLLGSYSRPGDKPSGLFGDEDSLQGHMLLAAAEAHQSSYEISDMQNGLFTTYLLQGLAKESIATFTQLFEFARGKVEEDAARYEIDQNPHLIPRAEGDIAYRSAV